MKPKYLIRDETSMVNNSEAEEGTLLVLNLCLDVHRQYQWRRRTQAPTWLPLVSIWNGGCNGELTPFGRCNPREYNHRQVAGENQALIRGGKEVSEDSTSNMTVLPVTASVFEWNADSSWWFVIRGSMTILELLAGKNQALARSRGMVSESEDSTSNVIVLPVGVLNENDQNADSCLCTRSSSCHLHTSTIVGTHILLLKDRGNNAFGLL